MIGQLNEIQNGHVRLAEDLFTLFSIANGVKQGFIFSIVFSVILQQATIHMSVGNGVYIRFRLGGSIFNLRRLKLLTLASDKLLRKFLFADDAALIVHTEEALQRITVWFSKASEIYIGLVISLKKTEVPTSAARELYCAHH